jgi:hypothetical protein
LATLLVSFPNPPREVAATSATLTSTDPVLTELAGRDALSVADASGDFVVGLTILPPRPGPAEVRVQVLGVDAGDGLRNGRFAGSSGSSSISAPLDRVCGLGCFAGDVTFPAAGVWTLKVAIDSNRGPIAIAESVPLPAPDGSAALARTLASEEGLTSAVLTESLSGSVGGPTYVSTYRFEAPDRVEVTLNGTSQILAGLDQYRQTGSGPWTKTYFPAPGFSWPVGYYRDFWQGAQAVRIIGTDTVDGGPAEVIAFIRPDIPAWFRVWVRPDGVVLQDEMRAEGHIMDHAYTDLNVPITVQVPP